MLKITPIQHDKQCVRIRLYGAITEEYLPEIERLLFEQPVGLQVYLDLADVSFVDRAAMLFLCTAAVKNIAIENCPAYVSRWIQQEGRPGRPGNAGCTTK